MEINFSERLLLSITGKKDIDWQSKLEEIEKFKITEVALFLEQFTQKQREKIYPALLKSEIKKIPLVHLRHGMNKDEIDFLKKNYGVTYFTIHEKHFEHLDRWFGFYKDLYLEMNYDNFIPKQIDIKKIGGFCVDLAHFQVAFKKNYKEFFYTIEKNHHYFNCNHVNGYSSKENVDIHLIQSLKDFDYLKNLPKFLFGKVIALEVDNSIKDQLKFKKYLSELLSNKS
jgi:hypothetical protein